MQFRTLIFLGLALTLAMLEVACKSESKNQNDSAIILPNHSDVEHAEHAKHPNSGTQEVANADSTFIGTPYFRIDAEAYWGPLFSFLLYTNGELGIMYFHGKNPSVSSLFQADGDKKKLAQARYEKRFFKVRLDSAEFKSIKDRIASNAELFKRSLSGEEGGTGFAIDFWNGDSSISCTWQEPLPKNQADFVAEFYRRAFRKFDEKEIKMLERNAFHDIPTLQQSNH